MHQPWKTLSVGSLRSDRSRLKPGRCFGTGERDADALARPLDEAGIRLGGLKVLHVVSRWQLGAAGLSSDPLSPWCGEPAMYELASVGRTPLTLHPSRVVRVLGNPLPDPWTAASPWSDSVLQALYDAVHAAALTAAGATSLMHEAKVDVVRHPKDISASPGPPSGRVHRATRH